MNLRTFERAANVVSDILAGLFAFFVVFLVRYRSGWIPETFDLERQFLQFHAAALWLAGTWMALFYLNGLYRDWYLESRSRHLIVLARAVLLGAALLLLAMTGPDLIEFAPSGRVDQILTRSRLLTIGSYAFSLFTFAAFGRMALDFLARTLLSRGVGLENVLVLGANKEGRRVVRQLLSRPQIGLRPLGFLDEDSRRAGTDFVELPLLGKYADLPRLIEKHRATGVIISHSSSSHNEILRILALLESQPVKVFLIPSLLDVVSGHLRTSTFHGTDLMVLFTEHLPAWQAGLKRLMDLAASFAILLAAGPFLLLSMLAIKLDSPGPIFYSQERIGQYGRRFFVWKLRTMRTDAELAGPQWAGKTDNRITRVGKILRKSRLDEVPQLWCVFRGDMSLVGPRPEREFFIEKLRDQVPFYMRRLKMKPGLTGWAQVTLGYDNSIEDVKRKVMADLWYFENMSLTLDLQILMRTIIVVLTGKGAN